VRATVAGMPTAVETLCAMLGDDDPFDHPREELEPLWLEAVNERLEQRRDEIPVLGKLVEATGIKEISALDELIPLLFAHTNYKSYPQAFVTKGRWESMNAWLDTVSVERVRGVDVSDVHDQDEWLQALHGAGHMVLATSGTSGKNSFLPCTPADVDFFMRAVVPNLKWIYGIEPKQDRPVFILGPKYGPTRAPTYFRTMAEAYGRPDATYFLTDEPLRLADLSRMATLRKAMADGTAMPSEIAEHERQVAARQAEMARRLDELIEAILDHRDEPMILNGFWTQYWMILEAARERGIGDGSFHPETVLIAGGGTKGAVLPDDYQDQLLRFFGLSQDSVLGGYGMSEVSAAMPRIDGRYRIAPWIVPLIVDRSGERLVPQEGSEIEGRFAFFDVALEGRWGGVITGDRVIADVTTPSLTVVDGSVARYTDLEGGDDKLTCAGTIDAFVRGTMS
jgi:hypothetical protein